MDPKSTVPVPRSAALRARDPFAALRREMNELFEGFFPSSGDNGGVGEFMPRIDVKETDGEVRVSAELPGIDEKEVEISVDGDLLTIKGEKKEEKEEKGEEYYRLERSYGSFRRSVTLPCPVDVDKATASAAKGVFTVVLPKSAAAKKKTIAVKAA
ncbi:Hsp20/alpha crystallin family protein [bacterium]|nr:Hsp20/alpha crystallin family protein [bacterium]